MFKKILPIAALLCFCFAATAFADVADPSGWPRPRPRPPRLVEEYWITRINYHNPEEFKDKLAVDIVCLAPRHSVISYSVEALDSVYCEGTESVEGGEQTVTVYFPKLVEEGKIQAVLKTVCRLNVRETPFGLKQTDNDIYYRDRQDVFLIENDGEICSITQ